MWSQPTNDEGRLQGALSLWRRSTRDFGKDLEEEEPISGAEQNTTTNSATEIDSGTEGSLVNCSDGELTSDPDFACGPSPRVRKRRGSVTRRR